MSDEPLSNDPTQGAGPSIWQALEPSSSSLPDSQPAGRCGHVAVSCGEGGQRLVIFGGYNADGLLSDVWEFHLEAREWARVNVAAGPAPPERAYFRGCDGPPPGGDERQPGESFAYIFGGTDEEGLALSDVWCLDVENRAWHEVHRGEGAGGGGALGLGASVPCARSNHSMCRMGGVLAVHGGELPSGDLLEDLWLFNPTTASWSEKRDSATGPRPCARSSHCLAYSKSAAELSRDRSSGGSAGGSSVPVEADGSLVLFGGLGRDTDEDSDAEDVAPLNDLWVWRPASAAGSTGGGGAAAATSAGAGEGEGGRPRVWSLVMLNGVGPSPRSLAVLTPRPCGGDLFLFGGYGLVELPSPPCDSDGVASDAEDDSGEEESADIIMAYIDDLWRLDLAGAGNGSGSSGGGGGGSSSIASSTRWVDEEEMGSVGCSIVEGRNGHTLTWCGDTLVLFGGFVGDGFDAGLHIARPPRPPTSLE